MSYSFFDYKYNIDYHGEDFDSPYRICFTIFAIVSALIIGILCRKVKKENITKYLRIVSIAMIIFEISKVTWESYWDIKTGRGLNVGGFNSSGILSLETCSLFMYISFCAGFSKNENIKRCCVDWLVTIGLVAGLTNVFVPQGLKWYPFWTFGAFHNMIYHYSMVLTASILIFNRFYDFNFMDILYAYIPHAICSFVVITIDYITKWNYMLYRDPSALPLISNITNKLTAKGLEFVNTFIMLIVFFIFDAIFMLLYIGIYKLIDLIKSKIQNKKNLSKQKEA